MSACAQNETASVCLQGEAASSTDARPRMLIGVTSDQTCVVLRGRLHALAEAGFDVIVVSSPGRWLTTVTEIEAVNAAPIPMRRALSPWRDVIAFLRLCRLIARVKPEITDFSTPKCGLLGTIAAWLMRVPRRVYTLRGLRLESSHGLERWMLWCAERISCWCSNVVLCNSASLRDAAIQCRIAPARKLIVLGHGSTGGVDTERFFPGETDVRKRFGIPVDAPVVGFVGRLTRHKGIPELMEAFSELQRQRSECWLLLTGWFDRSEDALDERLRREIESHPRVLVTGSVDDPLPYYRAMDVFVLPTHREGFPNAALEAAACGLPVITTCATGARNAVIDGETGCLIPVGSSAAIAETALRLISNEELRKKLGRNARAWAVKHYERHTVLKVVVGFYRQLLMAEGEMSTKDAWGRVASANPADFGEIGDIG